MGTYFFWFTYFVLKCVETFYEKDMLPSRIYISLATFVWLDMGLSYRFTQEMLWVNTHFSALVHKLEHAVLLLSLDVLTFLQSDRYVQTENWYMIYCLNLKTSFRAGDTCINLGNSELLAPLLLWLSEPFSGDLLQDIWLALQYLS